MMKVVFLVGADSRPTRDAIEAVCQLQGVEVIAILLDEGQTVSRRRLKNFRNNIRRDGWSYPFIRILGSVRRVSDALVSRSVSESQETLSLLRKAFPERCFSFDDIVRKYSLKLIKVPNLNGDEAIAKLQSLAADLGVVLGARVLRRSTFSVPRLGCINLHKGRVPDYRGLPPGFWEVYDGAQSAGITVHFVDSGLDTGDVIATSEIPIELRDTPDTVLQKLHKEGTRVLAAAVTSIAQGDFRREPQPRVSGKTRTKPSRAQVAELRARLPHWKARSDLGVTLKNLYALGVYWSGLYAAVRAWHRAKGSRAAIFLHHRVNDYAKDVLTTDPEMFTAQLLALTARYPVSDSASLIDAIAKKRPFPATAVAIHFDDCYRDVYTNGAPILKALKVPATFFVNSGFLDTERVFLHDQNRYAFRFENLSSDDLRNWSAEGFEVGAHTVNHVDLGTCPGDQALVEIVESGRSLAQVVGKPIKMFSFPFGAIDNIRPDTAELVMKSDYDALFSAHGGYVNLSTSLADIPRMGCNGETQPLYLLLEVEGLAPNQLKKTFLKR